MASAFEHSYTSSSPLQSFPSRRSVVHSTEGIVACTQPLAARCGQKILDAGGNAADAAVAVAAGMNVTEPTSTGIGGDMFCLVYNAQTKKIEGLNGSGRAGMNCTLEKIRDALGFKDGEKGAITEHSVQSITVPGAAAGWVDTVERFGSGKLSMEQILAPAIELAENGFPVSMFSSIMWADEEEFIKKASPNFPECLKEDPKGSGTYRAPKAGEIFTTKHLAETFRTLAKEGKKGFYTGRIAEEIINVVKEKGGFLELEDLQKHMEMGSEPVEPISLVYNNGQSQDKSQLSNSAVELWEHPPNGQGIVALIALGIFEELQKTGTVPHFCETDHNSPEYIHAVAECLRIAFSDASYYVADPNCVTVPTAELLSRPYLSSRAKLFNPSKANPDIYDHGNPLHQKGDTVYFNVTDKQGNAISFINSLCDSFGSGIIPHSTGFCLQSRGANFNLEKGHNNAIAPGKRPYNTIIPAMITNAKDGSLHSTYGVMGGYMQPQGHVQVLLNMQLFKHNPQTALDAPRFFVGAGDLTNSEVSSGILLEEGIGEEVGRVLREKGHEVGYVGGHGRSIFGKGQVVRVREEDDGRMVYSAGSDPRGDGAAFPA